jgi:hypothetical protein
MHRHETGDPAKAASPGKSVTPRGYAGRTLFLLFRGSIILGQLTSPTFPSPDFARAYREYARARRANVRIITGHAAILKMQPVLAALAVRCRQAGEVDSLPYFLSTPDALKKRPRLILIHRDSDKSASDLHDVLHNILGAVLIFEYVASQRFGSARVLGTTDGSGRRNVIAPPGERAHVAGLAAAELLRRGAQVVQIGFREFHRDSDSQLIEPQSFVTSEDAQLTPYGTAEQAITAGFREVAANTPKARWPKSAVWSLAERDMPLYLPLLPTFDRTLARIGQKTRANLRYYRRRTESELGCTFIPSAEINLHNFLAFNRKSFAAVSDTVARARFRSLSIGTNSVFCGLSDRDGQWLSLVRLRRQNRFAEIDWQMNRADLPDYSLATVVRSYIIEHEISLGSTRLYVEGGTAQAIGRSFVRGKVSEITVKRSSIYVNLLDKMASRVVPTHYLAKTLRDPALNWQNI